MKKSLINRPTQFNNCKKSFKLCSIQNILGRCVFELIRLEVVCFVDTMDVKSKAKFVKRNKYIETD